MRNQCGEFSFINSPNLPEAPVKLVLIDGRADSEIVYSLRELGIDSIRTVKHPKLPEPLAYHPDMLFCHLGGRTLVYAPGTSLKTLKELEQYGFELIQGASELDGEYPKDIPYNAAIVGDKAFHNFKYTDPLIIKILDKKGIKPVDVRQGYAKCSVSVVGRRKILTADRGIYSSALKEGFEALLLNDEINILLDGYEHGFIGGCTGLIDPKTLAFSGDSRELVQFDKISENMKNNDISIINLCGGKPVDIGSIIPLLTVHI